MIPSLSRLIGLTFLCCLGIPFALFALLTTTLALLALFLRLFFVYLDLFLALLNSALTPSSPNSPTLTPSHKKPRRRKNHTPPTPLHKSPSFASLVGSGTDRDYEGVGGWRFPESAEEEAVWMGMNRNLELPASPAVARKHHRRCGTGSAAQSPLLMRSQGTQSPEGYFNIKIESREGLSLTSRDG